ncbi:MAG: large subunit ribosomal protein L24e [Candidatus Woesearchaeota archaeon]|jgi:large subunit ribosomal protein L24e
MVKCSFSGKEIPTGSGIMYIKNDGKVLHFFDRKSEKNMLVLGRKPRTTKWTAEHHEIKKTKKQ